MAEAVKNITYRQPVPGTSTSNPSYIVGSVSIGGQDSLLIADTTVHQLLNEILVELKKLNLRQSEAFEEIITDEDVLCK